MTALGGSHGASYDRVVSAIMRVSGSKAQHGAGYIKLCCPAHEDSNPSVSVRYDAAKRRTTIKCFADCHDEDILHKVGLTIADLFDEALPERTPPPTPRRTGKAQASTPRRTSESTPRPAQRPKKPIASKRDHAYIYLGVDGTRVGKVVRFETFDDAGERIEKRFLQYRFDEDKRRWTSGKFEPLLYNAPDVAAAIAAGQPVHLFEGEKDADTAKALALTGPTTNPQGGGQFRTEHAEQLRGAEVVQVVDRDVVGYRHAVQVRTLLQPPDADALVTSYRCLEPSTGKDFTDHVNAGQTVDDLVPIDPVERFCGAQLEVARVSIDDGNTSRAERQLEDVRQLITQVADESAQTRLITVLENLTKRLAPPTAADELAGKRKSRQHQDEPDNEPAEPQWVIPTGSGSWAYSTGDDGDDLERGVYRYNRGTWQLVAPLPYVLERLTARTGDRTRAGMSYRIAMTPLAEADEVAIVNDDDVKTGVWADRLDIALAADSKVVSAAATAIRDTARRHAQARELVPRWVKGHIEMPPTDVGAVGYGELAGDEEAARETWREIIKRAIAAPKLALFLGAGVAALYVQPLELQSFVVLGTGLARKGKTSGLRCASAICGDPEKLIKVWNTSTIGLTQTLGNRAFLPSFFDELAASGLKGRDLEKIIFQITEGAQRTIGGKDGHSPKTSAPWHGIMFTASNDSILGEVANEGTAARVLEIPVPITRNSDDAKAISRLTRSSYGWPLHWLLQSPGLTEFAALIEEAKEAIGMPDGGVPETIASHLALIGAGTRKLEQLVGADGLYKAAISAGKALLEDLVGELNERGASADIRLITAVTEAFHARPAAFPTRLAYKKHLDGEFGHGPQVAREVEGWNLIDDGDYRGDLAVTSKALKAISAEAGIHDPYPALRQLRDGHRLIVDNDGQSRYQGSIRTTPNAKKSIKLYVFTLDEDGLEPRRGQGPSDSPPNEALNRSDAAESAETPSPLSPAAPEDESGSGDGSQMALTRTNDSGDVSQSPPVPTVPTYSEESSYVMTNVEEGKEDESPAPRVQFLGEPPAGLLWISDDDDPGPCRVCHQSARSFDDDGWRHSECTSAVAAPTQATASPAPAQQVEKPRVTKDMVTLHGPIAPPPEGFRASCAVIDPSGIYLPDGTRFSGVPIADALDVLTAGEKLELGHPSGAGQLILTDAMCVALGLVAEAPPNLTGDAARDHVRAELRKLGETFLARAQDVSWEIPPLNVENRARRRRDDRMLEIVLAPYEYLWTRGREDAHPLGTLDENLTQEEYAAEAARLMGYLAYRLRAPWRGNPAQVGWDIFDRAQRGRKRRKGRVLTAAGVLPKLTGDIRAADVVPQLTWSRWTPSLPANEADQTLIRSAAFAVHLDRKAAWCASAKDSTLGYVPDGTQMSHIVGAEGVAALLQRPEAVPAGLFRLNVPPAENRALPPLHALQSPKLSRWIWLPSSMIPALLYSDDPSNTTLGWGCSPAKLVATPADDPEQRQAEAWIFPAQGRLLDGEWYETLRDARYKVDEDGDATSASLIKRIYAAFLQTAEGPATERVLTGKRPWKHQATWLSTSKGNHYARQDNLVRRAVFNGLLVASVQIDEVVLLVDDPEQAVLGKMTGLVGQYQVKTVRKLTDDHRQALASGKPAHELKGGEVSL